MSFSLMAAPTGNATKAFASLGMTQLELADDMRKGGLIPAMEDLKAHLDASGLSASQQAQVLARAFGGGRSDAAILTLLEQLDRLKTKYDAIGASAGTFAEKVAATHETNQFKLNAALAQMQVTLIDLGGTVMPLVVTALQKLTIFMEAFVAWWDKLSPSTQKWIVIGLGLLAVLGPLLVILGSVALAVGALIGPVGAVIGIIALLVAGVAIATNGIIADIKMLEAAWKVVWTAIKDVFIQIWDDIKSQVNAVVQWITDKINAVISAFNAMKSLVSGAVNFAGSAFGGAASFVGNVFNSVSHFETGGMVPGLRGQEVPIIAHAGEEIIPAGQSSGRGSTNITVQINYPTVRNNSDLDTLRKQIEQVMRPVLLNAKVAHI